MKPTKAGNSAARAMAALALVFVAGCGRAGTPEGDLARVPLVIATADGARHVYTVEVALSGGEQARGLMHRREMARNQGMIFPFAPARAASFWMVNTYIPLDMIFILPGGRIESIIADVPPLTEEARRSLGPVAAALELNAGEAARIGAAPGDRVEYDLRDLQPAGN